MRHRCGVKMSFLRTLPKTIYVLWELGSMPRSGPDISEIYNPGIFTCHAHRFGLQARQAFDIICRNPLGDWWDFRDPTHRAWAKQIIQEEQPNVLIGSPLCIGFSQLYNLTAYRMNSEKYAAVVADCMTHLRFLFELY